MKSQKTEPFDWKKAKDKYFMKKLNINNNNNNNINGLLADPLDGSSLLKYINIITSKKWIKLSYLQIMQYIQKYYY